MELFVVNRYTGESKANSASPNESHLRKVLIEKVNQRKKSTERKRFERNNCNCTNASTHTHNTIPSLVTSDEERHVFKSKEASTKSFKKTEFSTSKKEKKQRKHGLSMSEANSDLNEVCKKKRFDDELQNEEFVTGSSKLIGRNIEAFEKQVIDVKPFSVLGNGSFSKLTKVKRSIPQWLANPSVVSVDLKRLETPVGAIAGLDEKFTKTLKDNNITHFFPVQRQIIPWLLENLERPIFYWPSDICVSAPTGSGKTLAFVLPILQALDKRITPQVRAIVVLPGQDLAEQVYTVFKTYSKPTKLNILLLSKKRPFLEEQSLICKKDDLNGFTTLVDVIVTTAGRLVDHLMNTNGLSLKHLKYLVIDEADRVMEDMQNDWLYHLNKKILSDTSKSYQTPILTFNTLRTKRRLPQKLLFSATLSQDPEKLQQLGLFQPKLFTSVVSTNAHEEAVGRFIGKYTTPAELQEYFLVSAKTLKPLVIHHLLVTQSWRSVLCFVNSIQATKRLSFLLKKLNKELQIKSISAKLSPAERNKLIHDFSRGYVDVLISSDALARGIDIPNVKYVISYNRPKYLKTYIHRIGRTGRAGKLGVSLILLTEKEVNRFKQMIEDAGKNVVNKMTVDETRLEPYTEDFEMALRSLESRLKKEKEFALSAVKYKKIKNKI